MAHLKRTTTAAAIFSLFFVSLTGCPGNGTNEGLRKITLTPASKLLPAGSSVQLIASGEYEDGTVENVTPLLVWSSSDESVVEVSNDFGTEGRVDSIAPGTAVVTAEDPASGLKATATIEVTAAELVELRVAPEFVALPLGLTTDYSVTAVYSDGSSGDVTDQATFSSSAPAVAAFDAVTANRLVSASVGIADISVSFGGKTATAYAEVVAARITGLRVEGPTDLLPGQKAVYQAFATFSDGSEIDYSAAVSWSSSDPGYISVSNEAGLRGNVTSSHDYVFDPRPVTLEASWNGMSATLGLVKFCPVGIDGYSGGTGTAQDPFILCNHADLLRLKVDEVNWNKHFRLISNLDLREYSSLFYINGTFTGTFDGGGRTISGITMNAGFGGVFFQNEGTIRGLHVRDATITAQNASAGLVNINGPGGLIEDSSFHGQVTALQAGRVAAGFVYMNQPGGRILRCGSDAVVRSPGNGSGFVVNNFGTIESAYARYDITSGATHAVGALAMLNEGFIRNAYAVGTAAPGIEGPNGHVGVHTQNAAGSLTDVYFASLPPGPGIEHGVLNNANPAGTQFAIKTESELRQRSTFVGWDFQHVWTIQEGSSYPKIIGHP